LIPGVTKSSW